MNNTEQNCSASECQNLSITSIVTKEGTVHYCAHHYDAYLEQDCEFCEDCGEDLDECTCTDDDVVEDEDDYSVPQGAECEQCDSSATHSVEIGYLCDDCHGHYVDGFIRD